MRFNFLAIVPVLSVASALALELPKSTDVGVYVTDGSAWREAQVEIVNWKSGGGVQHFLKNRIAGEDANGRIRGGTSSITFPGTSKIEVLIHTTEGTDAEEYQLLRLHSHSDSREFRSSTGGARRDLVPAKAVNVAPQIWRVELSGLPDGEYGFLPPVNTVGTTASGKIYTFDIGNCDDCKSARPGNNLIHTAKMLLRNGQGPGFDF